MQILPPLALSRSGSSELFIPFLFLRRPSRCYRASPRGLVGSGSANGGGGVYRASVGRSRAVGGRRRASWGAFSRGDRPSAFVCPLTCKPERHFLIETTKFTECDSLFLGGRGVT